MGCGVMDRGWGFIEAHPWNWLGECNLLFCPWDFVLFPRFDDVFIRRLERVFQSLQSVKVGIVLGVLDSEYGVLQFCERVNPPV